MLRIALFEPSVTIFIVTVALVIISQILQMKFLDKAKMKRQREESKVKQEKLRKLIKEGGKEKEVEKLQAEIMEDTMEMMQMSNKMMLVSLPIFLLIFWVLGFVYGDTLITSLFPIPKTGWFYGIPVPYLLEWRTEASYRVIYFYYYFAVAIVVGIAKKIYDGTKLQLVLEESLGKKKK